MFGEAIQSTQFQPIGEEQRAPTKASTTDGARPKVMFVYLSKTSVSICAAEKVAGPMIPKR
jgi:hypothetical protein